ncbi:MAG: twin-arginine translocation signal domain-containing protein [Chloroflexi bacterium]|nr:twin-arginine translocation signal domain-containing protein [Chloroflexota bacterium]MBI3339538.1 twin-arginine translocation signal domain-containing protein [Chloroflexota bacterium]
MKNKPSAKISRRDAMKVLAVVAGAAALANVPDKWTKPGLDIGVLPAHAQTSSGYTLLAGASDPNANYCFNLISTATISPAASGIVLRYVITTSGTVTIASPALSGTIPTDISGSVSLNITVDSSLPFDVGDTVTVTWTFENASDGIGSGIQVFTSSGNGC